MTRRHLSTVQRQLRELTDLPGGMYRGRLAEDYDGIGQYVLVSLAGSSTGSAYKARVAAGDFGGGRVIPRGSPVTLLSFRSNLEVLLGNQPRPGCIDPFDREVLQGWGEGPLGTWIANVVGCSLIIVNGTHAVIKSNSLNPCDSPRLELQPVAGTVSVPFEFLTAFTPKFLDGGFGGLEDWSPEFIMYRDPMGSFEHFRFTVTNDPSGGSSCTSGTCLSLEITGADPSGASGSINSDPEAQALDIFPATSGVVHSLRGRIEQDRVLAKLWMGDDEPEDWMASLTIPDPPDSVFNFSLDGIDRLGWDFFFINDSGVDEESMIIDFLSFIEGFC